MNAIRRQGDILLIPADSIPEGLTEVPRERGSIVLAEGEATGHLHEIADEAATFLATDLAEIEGRFLAVESEVALTHPEHDTIRIPAGNYRVVRQREYQDASRITRHVTKSQKGATTRRAGPIGTGGTWDGNRRPPMTNREELAARLNAVADRVVRSASGHPLAARDLILSDSKTFREAAQLIRGSAPPESSRPFANAVAAELARARARFPGNSHQLAALVEGVGEVARALIDREETVDVLMGCVQVAAMAQRVAEDGDDDFPGYEPAPSDRVAEGARIDPMNFSDPWHPDSDDYVATNLLRHIDEMPNSGDWHGMLRAWAEQRSTGKLQPNRPYEPAPTEPAPAEEARVEALKAALEWVADNYPAAITAMPTSLFRPLRESPVESSQEARRVCTCNAIDTPHGPAPDEKTPGCPVHSPAPAVREEARAEYDWQRKCPTCGARPTTNCKEPSIYDEARAYREALKAGAATLMEWAPDFLDVPASTRVREDDEARVDALIEAVNDYLYAQNTEGYKDRESAAEARRHLCETVYPFNVARAALEPAPPTLKGEDE